MTRVFGCKRLMAALLALPLMSWGCSASDVRDALVAGAMDFVSGTISDTLTALLPIADTISGA